MSLRSSLLLAASLFFACPGPTDPTDAGSPADSGTAVDAGVSADAGLVTDAGVDAGVLIVDAGTRIAAGLSVAIPWPQGAGQAGFGNDVALALDANDHPLLAWTHDNPAGNTMDDGVFFSRWDGTATAWTTPVLVHLTGPIFSNAPLRHVSIAYDTSTRTLGIAYGRFDQRTPPRNEIVYSTHLALSTDEGRTFTHELVSVRQRQDSGGEEAYGPSLVMANGVTHLAYFQRYQRCTSNNCDGTWYLRRAGVTGDFTRTLIPVPADSTSSRARTPSLAVDSTGTAAVAFLVNAPTPSGSRVAYWKAGSTSTVSVFDSGTVQVDNAVAALAFDGTKPRIATTLVSSTMPSAEVRVASSDDGITWTMEDVPRDGQHQTRGVLALVAGTVTAVAAEFTTDTGMGSCGGGPKLSKRSSGGWTTCGLDPVKVPGFAGEYVNLTTTRDGKLIAAFSYSPTNNAALQPGIIVWRE